MIVADTNILVRIIVNDDIHQVEIAKNLLKEEQIYIPKTVFLELYWVLKSKYDLDKNKILLSLSALLKPSNVIVEDMQQIRQSLEWYAKGMEFADALHLSTGFGPTNQFITFDQALVKTSSQYPDADWRPHVHNPSELSL